MKIKKIKNIHELVLNDNNFLYYINPFNNKNISTQKKLDVIASFIAKKNKINKIPIRIRNTDIKTSISTILTPNSDEKKRRIKKIRLNNLSPIPSINNLKIFKFNKKNENTINLIPLTLQKSKSSYELNFLNNYEKNFFFDEKYFDLKYDVSEIYKEKSIYDKLILDKINYLKRGIFDNKTIKLEKVIHYGNDKKEINLTLNSLILSLEDIVSPPKKQNKNLKLNLPISLLPLFYYKGIETFQKLLTAIVKVENNFEKISLDEREIEIALNNMPDFKTIYDEETKNYSLKKNLFGKKIIKNECLRSPAIKRNLNFLNFNYFIFFWVMNTRTFSAKITLPCIILDIIEEQISMKLFIDFELLFFLYERNFQDWEFYVIKYLSTFSKYRSVFEHLGTNKKFNEKIFFLKEPRTKINSFSEETLINIYTDKFYHNRIISINSFYINAKLSDDFYSLENNYKILFNFFQYIKLYEISKYSNKIEFLSKFLEVNNEKHALDFNFKKYDEFDVNLWMENIKKFSSSSLKNNNNIEEILVNEYNIYNKKLKIEYKKPLWSIINFENKKEIIKTWEIGKEMEIYLLDSINNPKTESWTKFINICLEKINEASSEFPKLFNVTPKKKFSKFMKSNY